MEGGAERTFVRDLVEALSRRSVPRMSAALAFYGVFAVPPLLVGVLLAAGEVFGSTEAQLQLLAEVHTLFGEDARRLVASFLEHMPRPGRGDLPTQAMAVFVLVFASTSGFTHLQSILNDIWESRPERLRRRFALKVVKRFLSFVLVLGFSIALVGAAAGGVALNASPQDLALMLPAAVRPYASVAIEQVLFVLLAFVSCAMIYEVLPDRRVPIRSALLGAGLAAVLLAIARAILAVYLAHTWRSMAFGAAGSLVAMLLAFYVAAFVLLLGAIVSRVHAVRHEPPPELPLPPG